MHTPRFSDHQCGNSQPSRGGPQNNSLQNQGSTLVKVCSSKEIASAHRLCAAPKRYPQSPLLRLPLCFHLVSFKIRLLKIWRDADATLLPDDPHLPTFRHMVTYLIKSAKLRGKYFAVLLIFLLLPSHFGSEYGTGLTVSFRCLFLSSALVHRALSTKRYPRSKIHVLASIRVTAEASVLRQQCIDLQKDTKL
jgi:hypothetical protein